MADDDTPKVPSFKGLTSKKVAGIPLLYIVLVIAAVALYGAIRLPKAELDVPVEEEETGDDGGDMPDTSQPVFRATPVLTQPSGVSSVSAVSGEDTNELWKRRTVEWLIANGTSYNDAANAISKFLAGEPLTANESGIKDKAIRQFGIPPEGVIPALVETPETPTPGTVTEDPTPSLPTYTAPPVKQGVPPLMHVVRGTSDNNARELARIYYGRTDEEAQALIRAANHDKAERPGPLGNPGESIRVPAYTQPRYYKATSATRSAQDIAAKNGTGAPKLRQLNPGMNFPVAVGTRVRVA